jgi:hypothetical protein
LQTNLSEKQILQLVKSFRASIKTVLILPKAKIFPLNALRLKIFFYYQSRFTNPLEENMLLKSNLSRLLFVVCLVLSVSVFAFADTIRLKDGSIIKGKIISFGGGVFTVVIGDDARRRQMTFRADEIESIKFETDSAPTGAVNSADTYKADPPTIKTQNNSTVITVGQSNKPVNPPIANETDTAETVENNTANTPPSNIKPIEINVKVLSDNTSNGWTNSGWVVRKGQKIKISGSGRISLGGGRFSSASGIVSLPDADKLIKDQATGGLIAVIGDDNNEFIFIGAEREFIAARDGALFLGVNEGNLNDNSSAFDVKIEISPIEN